MEGRVQLSLTFGSAAQQRGLKRQLGRQSLVTKIRHEDMDLMLDECPLKAEDLANEENELANVLPPFNDSKSHIASEVFRLKVILPDNIRKALDQLGKDCCGEFTAAMTASESGTSAEAFEQCWEFETSYYRDIARKMLCSGRETVQVRKIGMLLALDTLVRLYKMRKLTSTVDPVPITANFPDELRDWFYQTFSQSDVCSKTQRIRREISESDRNRIVAYLVILSILMFSDKSSLSLPRPHVLATDMGMSALVFRDLLRNFGLRITNGNLPEAMGVSIGAPYEIPKKLPAAGGGKRGRRGP